MSSVFISFFIICLLTILFICWLEIPFRRFVFIGPGAIQFTVILNPANSFANDLEKASTPALLAMYIDSPSRAKETAIVEKLIIRPSPLRIKRGEKIWFV